MQNPLEQFNIETIVTYDYLHHAYTCVFVNTVVNISLVNWDVMHIGGDFGMANRTINIVHSFKIHVIINSAGVQ